MNDFQEYFNKSVEELVSQGKENALYELFSHLTIPERTIVLELLLYRYYNYLLLK